MFRTSVSRLLVTLQLLTIVGLILTSGLVVIRALGDYRSASTILAGAAFDRMLFDTMVMVRSQIPIAQTALLAEEDPRATIECAESTASDHPDELASADQVGTAVGMVAQEQRALGGAVEQFFQDVQRKRA